METKLEDRTTTTCSIFCLRGTRRENGVGNQEILSSKCIDSMGYYGSKNTREIIILGVR